jgi:hypothetical protein
MAYSTTIKPKEPFFLFVPSLNDIPQEIKDKNIGKWFALGEFFDTEQEAERKVRSAGYGLKKQEILKQQNYFAKVK